MPDAKSLLPGRAFRSEHAQLRPEPHSIASHGPAPMDPLQTTRMRNGVLYAAEWPCCHDPLRLSLGSEDPFTHAPPRRNQSGGAGAHQHRPSWGRGWWGHRTAGAPAPRARRGAPPSRFGKTHARKRLAVSTCACLQAGHFSSSHSLGAECVPERILQREGGLPPLAISRHPALRTSCVLCPLSSVLCPVSCVLCPVSCVLCPLSCVLCPVSSVLCPVSYVLPHTPSCALRCTRKKTPGCWAARPSPTVPSPQPAACVCLYVKAARPAFLSTSPVATTFPARARRNDPSLQAGYRRPDQRLPCTTFVWYIRSL